MDDFKRFEEMFANADDDDVLVPKTMTAAIIGAVLTLGLLAVCSIGELLQSLILSF